MTKAAPQSVGARHDPVHDFLPCFCAHAQAVSHARRWKTAPLRRLAQSARPSRLAPMIELSTHQAQDIVARTMRIIPFNQHCMFL
jgi:hypothetical protein